MPPFDQTPDQPEGFGYKAWWFAVKADHPAAVIEALQLGESAPANWKSGLAHVYAGKDADGAWIFASPPMGGWVLTVSMGWPYPTVEDHHDMGARFETLFSRLMKRFDDVQFFGSYRVVSFVTWARALNGEPRRVFAFGDEVFANLGAQTPEEAQLGFADVSDLSPSDALDRIFELAEVQETIPPGGRSAIPDEEDVADLAALWSINPTLFSDQDHPPSLGLAVRLPNDLSA